MAKRVFEIAKELGVKSKAIVEKCRGEGIDESVIKNHMSTVSVGLEQTIREWFADQAEGGESRTAIETAERVDLKRVKAPPHAGRARKAAKAEQHDNGDTQTATQTATPDSAEAPAQASPQAQDAPAQQADDAGQGQEGPGVTASAPGPSTAQPAEQQTKAASSPADTTTATTGQAADRASDAARDQAGDQDAAERDVEQDAERASDQEAERPGEEGDAARPAASDGSDEQAKPDRPGPRMNVPSRPKVIKPMGERLETKEKINLSGPKVVRVEAPERLEPPRPRGPRFEPGAPAAAQDDDGGRSPRRGGGGGGGPKGPKGKGGAGVPTKRRGKAAGPGGGGGWSEQDLAEREARIQRSGGYLKHRRQQLKTRGGADTRAQTPAQRGGKVTIAEPFTIKDLSAATGVKGAEIVKKLFMQGVMATINSPIEPSVAEEIMIDYDIELEVTEAKSAEQQVTEAFEQREIVDERPRGPVVTILGHVDHGKTSLLDRIRNAKVAAGEAGGITQATSAFRVPVTVGEEQHNVVFLDTPGHQAFTEMRSRGATMTDIVVLVVAADDGVMPQTIESINHAKAAGVPIVVALNKTDKPEATDANIQRILGQLAEHELNPTDWGGDTEVVRTSAETGAGVDDLIETLDFQAQILELKADFAGMAQGTVIEARPEEGRGSVANLLLQQGRLAVGDFIVAGRAYGRVRDITNDRGERLKESTPPAPVQISGIDQLPDAGDTFYVVDTLKKAQEAAEQRRNAEREIQLAAPKMTTLDSMFSAMAEKQLKEILVVLKADVQGSVDVLKNEIEKVQSDEVRCRVLHAAVGGITEADVRLAEASQAVIVGFNVIPSSKARQLADAKGVQIRPYQVIYDIVDDMKAAASGLLTPELRQEVLGHAEVRQVFRISKVGAIAGCYVTDGTVERDALVRVTRDDIVIENDRRLEQLKRFKDDVKEARAGMECGMKIVGYDDIKEGDILECYKQIEIKRTL